MSTSSSGWWCFRDAQHRDPASRRTPDRGGSGWGVVCRIDRKLPRMNPSPGTDGPVWLPDGRLWRLFYWQWILDLPPSTYQLDSENVSSPRIAGWQAMPGVAGVPKQVLRRRMRHMPSYGACARLQRVAVATDRGSGDRPDAHPGFSATASV